MKTTKNNIIDFAAILIVLLFGLNIILSPIPNELGMTFKLFYIHIPFAWISFLSVTVAFISNLIYINKYNKNASNIALASMKIAAIFCSFVLITGSIWGKLSWGVWWSWDPRLTATLILWISICSYLVLAGLFDDQEFLSKVRAILSIFCFINIPIIHLSVKWWRSLHPQAIILSQKGFGSGVTIDILTSVIISTALITFLYIYLILKLLNRK